MHNDIYNNYFENLGVGVLAMERNRKYLHALDPERLLHNYRVTAGLFGCSMLKGRQPDYRGP